MDTVKYTKCSKHGKVLIYKGCKYRVDKKSVEGTCYWKCMESGCAAKVKVHEEEVIKVYKSHDHSDKTAKHTSDERRSNGIVLNKPKEQPLDVSLINDCVPNPDELDLAELVRQKELLEAKLKAEVFKNDEPIPKTLDDEHYNSCHVKHHSKHHSDRKSIKSTQEDTREDSKLRQSNKKEASKIREQSKSHSKRLHLDDGHRKRTKEDKEEQIVVAKIHKIDFDSKSKRKINANELASKKICRDLSETPEKMLEREERYDRYASEREGTKPGKPSQNFFISKGRDLELDSRLNTSS